MEHIPDWQAYPRGFKDGQEGKPNFARDCSNAARPEYERGYEDGQQFAKEHPDSVGEEEQMKKPASDKKWPRAPTFVVNVTAEHIKHAQVRNSSHCVIAMAVREVKPTFTSIAVDLQTIRMSDREKGYRYTYLTPRIGQMSLIRFDQGVLPEPFSFRLYGGQVTEMCHHDKNQTPRPMSEAQKAALKKATTVYRGDISPATLREGYKGQVAERVGGRPPPMGAGKRRAFGLRALKY